MTIFNKETHPLKLGMLAGLFMVAVAAVGLVLDTRLLLGENVWLKPIKFGSSIVIYCTTIALLLSIYPYTDTRKYWISTLLGWAMVLEVPPILIQAARGVRSHYNLATAFDSLLFGMMGILILLNSVGLLYLMWTAFSEKLNTTNTIQRAVQFAWIAMLISMVAGQIMITNEAHTVAVPDGGTGIPITNWDVKNGDWRVVHFLGMHGIQLLPLVGYGLGRTAWQSITQQRVMTMIGVIYLLLIGYIFIKTQAGISFLA